MSLNAELQIPDHILKWVIEAVDPQAIVLSTNRLHGGISSIVHSIKLQVYHSEITVVLRQFDNTEWLVEEPDLTLHESESLRWAAKADIATPQIIAYDATGSQCGIPAVLLIYYLDRRPYTRGGQHLE
ncbi:hypothetical protein [Paenibacillus alkaliterrae]|nr:hypothetical protein [Paenibacillus alkaliterrae]